MKSSLPLYVSGALATLVLAATLGCSQHSGTADAPAGDPQITSAIQGKLYANPAIQSKQISVQTANGVVTLAGTVATDAERTQASSDAGSIPGVKTVINNISVAPPQVAAAQETIAPPPAPKAKPSASHSSDRHTRRQSDDSSVSNGDASKHGGKNDQWNRNADSSDARNSNSRDSASTDKLAQATPPPPVAAAPVVPPPPPPPAKVTVESGTSLAIRLVDSIDSDTAQQGQTFHATLDAPVAVDGVVVIPAGYDVEGHVVEVQSAGKFEGKSLLVLQLDRIQVGNRHYSISTTQYRREGNSRTKNTAEKVGAGAVIGAIIGGIAGGGKGAGIGAAAGGGIGGGVQATGKGQQIKLPSETVLTFSLQAPITVTPTTQPRNGSRPKLDPTPQDNSPANSNPPSQPQN